MKRQSPTAVIIRDPFNAYGQLSIFISKIIRAKIILYTQRPKYSTLNWRRNFLYRFATWALNADWITPVLGFSNRTKVFHPKVHYTPFVIRPKIKPQNKKWFINDEINILNIGKFQPRKNHCLFLTAISRLSKHYLIHATIIGECSTPNHKSEFEKTRSFCNKLGLDEKVSFMSNMPFSEVQKCYERHDVFVLPSRNEPAAISPLEAMACTLPIVCSDSNGTKCYIHHGVSGFIFQTDDLDDLTDCMDRILRNRKKLMEMGKRSYELTVSEHTPKKYVDTITAIAAR